MSVSIKRVRKEGKKNNWFPKIIFFFKNNVAYHIIAYKKYSNIFIKKSETNSMKQTLHIISTSSSSFPWDVSPLKKGRWIGGIYGKRD